MADIDQALSACGNVLRSMMRPDSQATDVSRGVIVQTVGEMLVMDQPEPTEACRRFRLFLTHFMGGSDGSADRVPTCTTGVASFDPPVRGAVPQAR